MEPKKIRECLFLAGSDSQDRFSGPKASQNVYNPHLRAHIPDDRSFANGPGGIVAGGNWNQ
ncbi:MAG TPA: hypothetical protein DCG12_02325 [Planctomycetaceae bacterium]|nr:hypothetical protein [Planctomycetaceae bacterium]